MTKPDFSGEWTLNVEACALSPVVAPVVEGGFVRIEHQEPTVSVHLSITMNGEPVEVRFQRPSNWDGEVLAFTDTVPTPDGDLTIAFRYELQDSGKRLRAAERLRGAGREQDNVWVFDRGIMRPLRYSINVTLDGCCDHRAMMADEELHRHAAENIEQADALLFGRVTYEMMEAGWRRPAQAGARPDWMEPFARAIDAKKKYVVSSTLDRVDWNAELVRGDLRNAVQQLKRQSGKRLLTGGVTLPRALAELGLIDEYELVVHPRLAGHGPTLLAGLSKHVDLKLVNRREFASGVVVMRYEPRRQ